MSSGDDSAEPDSVPEEVRDKDHESDSPREGSRRLLRRVTIGSGVTAVLATIGLVSDFFGIRSGLSDDLLGSPVSTSSVAAPTTPPGDPAKSVPSFSEPIADFEPGTAFQAFLDTHENQTIYIKSSISADLEVYAEDGEYSRTGLNDSPYVTFKTTCQGLKSREIESQEYGGCEGAELHMIGTEAVGRGGFEIDYTGNSVYRIKGFFVVADISGPHMHYKFYNLQPLSPAEVDSP
jgi:hypothetical protein